MTCARCLKEPPAFTRTVAAFDYAFPIDALIRAFKFQHRLALAHWFGTELAEALRAGQSNMPGKLSATLVLPMPMHPDRLRERGFNQAVELARVIAHELNHPLVLNAATRTRSSAPQEGLDAVARRRNQRGAFAATAALVGRQVLIVDDVMTTGASAQALASAIRSAGASDVMLAVAARADRGA